MRAEALLDRALVARAHSRSSTGGPGSLSTVVRPSRSWMIDVERSSPPHGTACSSMPSSAISAAAASPVRPGSSDTSTAGWPSARAARATLRPLPPGVTTTRSKRSTSPGRSSPMRERAVDREVGAGDEHRASSVPQREAIPPQPTVPRHLRPLLRRRRRPRHARRARDADRDRGHGGGDRHARRRRARRDPALRRPGRPAAAPSRAATSPRSCCAPTRRTSTRPSRPPRRGRS